jgi:hypothetical protein
MIHEDALLAIIGPLNERLLQYLGVRLAVSTILHPTQPSEVIVRLMALVGVVPGSGYNSTPYRYFAGGPYRLRLWSFGT